MIGWCRLLQRRQGWGPVSDAQVAEGLSLARQAIEAGKDDPDALWMGGYVIAVFAAERTTANSVIQRALMLNPNSAYAWSANGWVLCFGNQPRGAIEAFERAMRLSPLDPNLFLMKVGTAFAHMLADRFDEASSWAEGAFREEPNYHPTAIITAASNALAGRLKEAGHAMERLRQIDPTLRISNLKDRHPIRRPDDLTKFVEGLRKAGLPE